MIQRILSGEKASCSAFATPISGYCVGLISPHSLPRSLSPPTYPYLLLCRYLRIWGLFKEPLYPFVLFSVQLAQDWGGFPAGTNIYLQGEHRKDPKIGTLLGGGEASLRVATKIGFGAAAATYDDEEACGTFQFLDSLAPKEEE